jgi:hypothetical protein
LGEFTNFTRTHDHTTKNVAMCHLRIRNDVVVSTRKPKGDAMSMNTYKSENAKKVVGNIGTGSDYQKTSHSENYYYTRKLRGICSARNNALAIEENDRTT